MLNGSGILHIHTNLASIYLQEVWWIPSLATNLISEKALGDMGWKSHLPVANTRYVKWETISNRRWMWSNLYQLSLSTSAFSANNYHPISLRHSIYSLAISTTKMFRRSSKFSYSSKFPEYHFISIYRPEPVTLASSAEAIPARLEVLCDRSFQFVIWANAYCHSNIEASQLRPITMETWWYWQSLFDLHTLCLAGLEIA